MELLTAACVYYYISSMSVHGARGLGNCVSCTCSSALYRHTPFVPPGTVHVKVLMLLEHGIHSNNSSPSIFRFCQGSRGLFGRWCSQAWWRMGMCRLWWAVSVCPAQSHTHSVKGAYRQTQLGCQNVLSFFLCLPVESLWWAESLWTLSSSGRDERIEGLMASQ